MYYHIIFYLFLWNFYIFTRK